jgi:hypothetical protein
MGIKASSPQAPPSQEAPPQPMAPPQSCARQNASQKDADICKNETEDSKATCQGAVGQEHLWKRKNAVVFSTKPVHAKVQSIREQQLADL